jgi:hypothetical protein
VAKATLNPWAFFVRLKPHAPSDGRNDVFFTQLLEPSPKQPAHDKYYEGNYNQRGSFKY